ncbi:A-kinase anchor protein 9 isoform X3 [Atheta coriaria]|uniref:A-kinase anchor protein 9 isoform X3 n=1 Tax=Dalotia coriaria TaxID=877792 RepID=UPI0031F38706
MSGNSSPLHSTDTSLSLSPGLLPEKNTVNELKTIEQHSSISEHLSSLNSLENDRSLLEIEISNIPDLNTIVADVSPPISLSLSNLSNSAGKNVKSVLEEILHNEQFKSERSDRLDSNDDVSLNIFDGVNLDDSSINNYVLKLKSQESDVYSYQDDAKVRSLEDALSVKDSIIQALNVEVESLKDLASNQSTLSMNTTLTEYKMFQDECATKFVNFENALAHRDSVIAKLKDSLITAQKHEDEMRAECEQYSKDIQCVQTELAEAVEYIKKCKCKCLDTSNKNDFDFDLNAIYAQLEERLDSDTEFIERFKRSISEYVQCKLGRNDSVHEVEISRLQEKHVKEMDDTRKFYEEKCADLGETTQISNELVSPQSRKLSDEELQSEDDLSDLYVGEFASKSFLIEDKLTPEKVHAFKNKIDDASLVLSNFRFVANAPLDAHHYQAEIDSLRQQLDILQRAKELKDAGTQANSGDQEIDGIVQSYQVRLNEQVEQAKFDIMFALENNISKLAESECNDDDWPKEFLEIRNKLSAKYERQLVDIKNHHEMEVSRLNEKLSQVRSIARNCITPQRSQDGSDDEEITKERQTTNTLRNLLIDCYKYFGQCEEELNTTLFEELAKNSMLDSDSDHNIHDSNSSSSKTDVSASKRVHLAPNIQEYIEKIDKQAENVSMEFKNELRLCLARLKSEANAILELTCKNVESGSSHGVVLRNENERPLEDKIQSLRMQIASDAQIKEELNSQLSEAKQLVQTLENEKTQLDHQMEGVIAKNRITEDELARARDKIGELIDYGRKEVVSEGYGENMLHGGSVRTPLVELNERARQIIAENKCDSKTLRIIEELSRECDQLVEDAKRERLDFVLQIESADKKLKSTQRFLEEQAVEREQERDEASKTISVLRDQLKDRLKDRAGYERVNEETMDRGDTWAWGDRGRIVQIERSVEGFEKQMHEMSKLISEGEKRFQVVNVEREEAIEKIGLLRDIIKDLEKQIKSKEDLEAELQSLLRKQREANDVLVQELDAAANTTNFEAHIIQLEEEVIKLRRANDIVGNEGLIKQIQSQLHELELLVDKNIREIESLYATRSATTCSTPSEEMSVQDQIRPKTPNSTVDDCEVPLQQLSRLKEKLLKHSRAENSALKRIQDMELQLLHAKQEHDELHNEKDVLQEQVSEQLVLISSLQMRLDDQRIRAEHVQKQANASLEMRIYDLENDLQALRDKLQSRESTIKNLNKIIEETKQRLRDREEELSSTLEESEVCDLKAQIDRLKADNEIMRQKIENDAQNAQILPSLVDNIIADKNKDIESLRLKLEDTERQFELFRSSCSADKTDDVTRDVYSLFNVSSPERMRGASSVNSPNLTKFVPEISSIEKCGPPNLHYTTDGSLMKPNSTEIQKTIERHVHFEDEAAQTIPTPEFTGEFDVLNEELQQVKEKLEAAENNVSELRVDLAQAKMHLTERETELNGLHEDAKRKDDMYMQLAKEKREIEMQFDTLDAIRHSIEDLQKNELQLKELLQETREKYAEKEDSCAKLQTELANYQILKEEEIINIMEENKKRCETLITDLEHLNIEYQECRKKHNEEMKELKRLLEDRECELEILNEDVTRYQNEIHTLEDRLKQVPKETLQGAMHKKELAEKELEIVKLKSTIESLKRETSNILDHLTVKEEIIDRMKVDSEALRINLETIKAKMNESGNIYDLRQKLVREREFNAQLHSENEASIDEVAYQVRQQLNDSAVLDDKIFTALGSGDFNNYTETEILEANLRKERKSRMLLAEKFKELEVKFQEAMETEKQLQSALDDQKKLFDHVQVEDTNMMSQIRAKLEEAMATELEYEAQLNKERSMRLQLENDWAALRRNSNSVNSATEYVSLGNLQEQRLQREIKQLQEEVVNLKREIKILKKSKNSADCEIKYSKEMLTLKDTELVKLEKKLVKRESEIRMLQDNLKQQKIELDMKISEIENSKVLVSTLEQDKLQLTMKVTVLEARQPVQSSSIVPDVFLQKMKDLGELVTEHINENKLMSDTIMKLTTERNQLEGKIRLLEERDRMHVPFDDPVSRANHLFGKYLRADSYRHALSFQKKYLIGLLATYQDAVGHPLGKFEPKRSHAKKRGVNRFRSVAVVFIAIFRMKYMVQRWHSGSRGFQYMSLQRRFRSENLGTHFQVGKPVSGDHFRIGANTRQQHLNLGASTSGIPCSGMSPPCKDATQTTSTKVVPEVFEQMRPRAVDLDSYFERFNLIQQRLGTTLNTFNS